MTDDPSHLDAAELLEAVLERDDLSDYARNAFEDMQRQARSLSPKQRAWAEAAFKGERYEPESEYENMVSRGLVERGKEVELMVKARPLKPPGRK
jgi:hypothetical protein